MAITTTLQQVEALYIGYFGRAGEPVGTNYWIGRINSGFPLADAAASFSVQPEAKAAYTYLNTPNLSSPSDFVDQVYMNLFNRVPDAAGKAYWVAELTANQGSAAYVGKFILSVINGAYGPGGDPTDALKIDNKIAAASHFTDALADNNISGTEVVDGVVVMTADALAAAKAAVGPAVTEDPATVDTANAASDDFVITGSGQTFVLQAGVEHLIGTNGNDLFIGDNTTLTTDVLNGAGGNDTLRVTAASAVLAALPTLSNIENIEVSAHGFDATINLINSTGFTKLVSSNGADNVLFSGVKAITDLAIANTTFGEQSIIYAAAAVAGTADVQKIALSSATAGVINVDGIETVDVTATGKSALVSLFSDKLATVKIGGEGSLAIFSALAGATTVDASANKGGVNLALDTKDVTVTGGSGNDVFEFATGLNNLDKINGGDGTDTLRITETSLPAVKLDITSIETLQVDMITANRAVNVDLLGGALSLIRFGDNTANNNSLGFNTVTITNGLNNSTIEVQADAAQFGQVSFAAKADTAADVLTLKLVNTDNSGVVDGQGVGTFTANTVETLNIDASNLTGAGAMDAEILVVGVLNANAATSLVITGDSTVWLGYNGSTLGALTNVDAAAATQSVNLGRAGFTFNTAITGADFTTGSGDDAVWLSVGGGGGVLKTISLGADTSATSGTGDLLGLSGGVGAGVTIADLTAADQIAQLLGSGNIAVQSGIESVDFTGLAGSAIITGTSGANNLTGTAGNDTIDGGAGNDIINGGGGLDSITGGAGADTLSGGLGVDVFNYGSLASINTQTGITLATADVITDFLTGGADKIKIGTAGVGGGGGNYVEAGAAADFATALGNANAALGGGVVYYLTSTVANGGLLFFDGTGAGNATAVIRLLGITDATFAAADIIA